MIKAQIELKLQDKNLLEILRKVFEVTKLEMKFHKGYADSEVVNNHEFIITIYARDLSSLRSLVNGVLKTIYLILKIASIEDCHD